MPVAIAVIVCVVLFAALLLGVLWALIVLVPIYVVAGLTAHLVLKNARKEVDARAAVQRDAERQRAFNEREARAWRASIEKD